MKHKDVLIELSKHVGIENIVSVKHLMKKYDLNEMVAYGAVAQARKELRKDHLFLRNARIWIDKKGNVFTKQTRPKTGRTLTRHSGYFVLRMDKGRDIVPPENTDFDIVVSRFASFLDVLQNTDKKVLQKEDKKALNYMKQKIVEAVMGI